MDDPGCQPSEDAPAIECVADRPLETASAAQTPRQNKSAICDCLIRLYLYASVANLPVAKLSATKKTRESQKVCIRVGVRVL
jgi:hypothetical protein